MKENNHLIYSSVFVFLALSCAMSCGSNEEMAWDNTDDCEELPIDKDAVYAFSNREDIVSAVNSDAEIPTRAAVISVKADSTKGTVVQINEPKILLLTDKVQPNDPILDEVSDDEKSVILEEEMTYYDLYGCEEYIPSESFAKLLNSKREIQLDASLYRITEFGTLRTFGNNSVKLELAYNIIKADTTIAKSTSDFIPVTKDVVLHPYNEIVYIGEPDGQAGTRTRSSVSDMPTDEFKHYMAESKTCLGKALGAIFGDRSVKHHEFMNKRRVNGSLYSYNYLVYHESGSFVSMSKKRGGFFKFINGWKDIKADELFMQYKGIVLEMNIDVPQGYLPAASANASPVVDSYSDLYIQGVDNVIHKTVNILGYNIKEKDVLKYIGMGAKQMYKCLKNEVGNPQKLREIYGADESIPAVRVLTPQKVYVVIPDATYNPKNEKKMRKVFSSGVTFLITVTNGKFGWSDFVKSLQGTRKLPVKKMIGGEVLLAGKLDGKWGGMYIKKEK